MANSPGFVVSTSQGNVKLWSPFICAPGDPGKATLDTSARRGGPAWKILRHELIPLCMLTALTFPEVRSLGDQSPAKNVNSGTCTTTVGYPPRALALASDPTSCEAKVTGQVRPMNSKALLHAPSSPNLDGSPDLISNQMKVSHYLLSDGSSKCGHASCFGGVEPVGRSVPIRIPLSPLKLLHLQCDKMSYLHSPEQISTDRRTGQALCRQLPPPSVHQISGN